MTALFILVATSSFWPVYEASDAVLVPLLQPKTWKTGIWILLNARKLFGATLTKYWENVCWPLDIFQNLRPSWHLASSNTKSPAVMEFLRKNNHCTTYIIFLETLQQQTRWTRLLEKLLDQFIGVRIRSCPVELRQQDRFSRIVAKLVKVQHISYYSKPKIKVNQSYSFKTTRSPFNI